MSIVVIVTKSSDGLVKCYLYGRVVCNKSMQELSGKKSGKTNMINIKDIDKGSDYLLVAHKPGNKKGKVHGLFHGYIYGISLYAMSFEPYELNTMYRQLCVHRDLHVVSTWFRNKNELSHSIYKQFL